jgi:aromatic amino acid aminotransferase I
MDGEGISATSLEKLLSNWHEEDRGGPKPFLLYTIPTGHNPTGVTQTRQRREEIYAVAQRHDLLIIEDDPYYYMHYPQKPEVKGSTKQYESAASPMDKYFDSLPRSYLSMDISGRVVRLDSTSKILAPGLRCSWMTANSGIIAKFLCHHDVGIVCPSGLSQLILANLLEHTWGHNGFADWLMYLCDVYARRCETLVRACKKYLPQTLCTWHRPEAGMFLWIKINWRKHPTAGSYEDRFCAQSYSSIEQRIFDRALTKGALVCKGSAFRASSSGPSSMFLRLTFATASSEGMEEAVKRLGEAIDEEFDM